MELEEVSDLLQAWGLPGPLLSPLLSPRGTRAKVETTPEPAVCASNPELTLLPPPRKVADPLPLSPSKRPCPLRDGTSASETLLLSLQNEIAIEEKIPIDQKRTASGDQDTSVMTSYANNRDFSVTRNRESRIPFQKPATGCFSTKSSCRTKSPYNSYSKMYNQNKQISPDTSACFNNDKKSKTGATGVSSPPPTQDTDPAWARQMRDIRNDVRSSARVIRDSRLRLLELQKKQGNLTELDVKELKDRHELLLREMERFDRLTRSLQRMVDQEVKNLTAIQQNRKTAKPCDGIYQGQDTAFIRELQMEYPPMAIGPKYHPSGNAERSSRSEIDLTRKLSESYDMQEKLVADNADLEVKRYILYKELMTKDQNLETCRAQMKRLQDELKMITKENAMLHERLSKNNPEGDATTTDRPNDQNKTLNQNSDLSNSVEKLTLKLETYHCSSTQFETQLTGLETEVQTVKLEMDAIKKAAEQMSRDGEGPGACRTKGAKGPCYTQPSSGPQPPPQMKACGVCPPCPAPCNPNAPPTPAEREAAKLAIQLKQTEENFKVKVTECAMLRSELMKKKEELEKERCQHRELQARMRDLEMKYEGLKTNTNMLLGTKEQAFEMETNVSALKQCYREARDEIEELRQLLREQNDQLQDYRVKYMQAQQLVEEQKRQMDMMDMDNSRISEQINLEIQKVKIRFQEKLQELSPLPELLKATQLRLKDAQQSQALAEHTAEQLARELNVAREKVHILMHNATKPPPEQKEAKVDEKQLVLLSQRISQLTETNATLKQEIERLKGNVIRMEEAVLQNERRLQEKIHECAQLGGELDRTRDECARALQRANERNEVSRKCMQTTIAELERQLAASRAQVRTAEKEREELQCRMSCQISRLKDNFDQAQLRIMGLTTQIATLRQHADGGGDEDDDQPTECVCKSLFEKP